MFVRMSLQFDKKVMRDGDIFHSLEYLVMLAIMVMLVIVFVVVMVLMSVNMATLQTGKLV